MLLNRLLGRSEAALKGVRFVVTFDEPFVGLVYQDGATVRQVMHPLDPERLDTILADLSPPALAHCPFTLALRDALRGETYDAFEQWFAWLRQGDGATGLSIGYYCANKLSFRGTSDPGTLLLKRLAITVDDPDSERAVAFRHLAATGTLDPRGTDNPRVADLEKLWLVFHDFTWRSSLRFGVLESVAIALSKHYGSVDNCQRALHFVEATLREPHKSVHLKAARHALYMRAANQAVSPRLEKFVGADSGYLKDFVCEMPFQRFDIVETGEINLCCGHWLPKAIGSIDDENLLDTLNSDSALAIRRSMLDGSYKYCNHLECVRIAQDGITPRNAVNDPKVLGAMATGDVTVDHLDNMLFAYDQSCNLACPSCRRERIIERPSQNEAKARNIEAKLKPLIGRLKHLEINVAGEIFVSKPSRQILGMISPEACPDLGIDLISNGVLFTPVEWAKFPGIHGKVNGVRISIDAARKPTFEKLRRFANYETLLSNLEFLSGLRRRSEIGGLSFSFTYQLENFLEMEEFVEFGRGYGVDKVIFEPLQNVGAFSDEEYRARAVHKPDHHLYSRLIEMIRRPVFQTIDIQHDFSSYDFETFTRADPIRARDFSPISFTSGLEGLVAVPGRFGAEFRAVPTEGRHRVMMRDDGVYEGRYRVTASIRPLETAYFGVELHSTNLTDYGRILVDVAADRVSLDHSVVSGITDVDLACDLDGRYRLSFTFVVTNPSGIMLNIYLADDKAEVIWLSDGRAGFVAGPIRAVPLAATVEGAADLPAIQAPAGQGRRG
jgi:MoaA/NifB/PqqE/SkfB family radical SAM enzyme